MLTYKVMVIAALILSLAASLIWNWNQHLDKLEMRDALAASQSRVEELRADIRRQAEALAEREKKITALANEKYRLNKRLKEAIDREQEVREWAYDRVPDAVCGLLREKRQPPAGKAWQARQPESEMPESWNRARIISLPEVAE